MLTLRFGDEPADARANAPSRCCATVGIPDPATRLDDYPHELSGGMQPARDDRDGALDRAALLIADEPTTALDVTVQAQILHLIRELQKRPASASCSSRTTWAWSPRCATRSRSCTPAASSRQAPIGDIFKRSRHPYTKGLLRSLPQKSRAEQGSHLPTIEGVVPSL